jgi:hypothetical protein
MEATPSPSPYKVVFEAEDESILVQHIIHRDFLHTSWRIESSSVDRIS